jgi:hypothetical protein
MADVAEPLPRYRSRQPSATGTSSARWLKKRRLAGEERERAVRALVYPEIRDGIMPAVLNPSRCDECRRVKEKCEGGVPCNRCAHFQRPCEFKGSAARQPNSSTQDQRFALPYKTIS